MQKTTQIVLTKLSVKTGEDQYRTKVFQTDQNVAEQFPVCEQVCSEILSIPCHPALTDDQVERVIKGVQQAAQG